MKQGPVWREGLCVSPEDDRLRGGDQYLPRVSREGFLGYQNRQEQYYNGKDTSLIYPGSQRICQKCILMQAVELR